MHPQSDGTREFSAPEALRDPQQRCRRVGPMREFPTRHWKEVPENCTGGRLTKGAIPVPYFTGTRLGQREPQHRLVYISELRYLYRPSVRPQALHFMGRVGPGEPNFSGRG